MWARERQSASKHDVGQTPLGYALRVEERGIPNPHTCGGLCPRKGPLAPRPLLLRLPLPFPFGHGRDPSCSVGARRKRKEEHTIQHTHIPFPPIFSFPWATHPLAATLTRRPMHKRRHRKGSSSNPCLPPPFLSVLSAHAHSTHSPPSLFLPPSPPNPHTQLPPAPQQVSRELRRKEPHTSTHTDIQER